VGGGWLSELGFRLCWLNGRAPWVVSVGWLLFLARVSANKDGKINPDAGFKLALATLGMFHGG
jgi:hypothetical protein